MNTLHEIKRAIEALLTSDRAQLIRWLRDRGYVGDSVSERALHYGRAFPSDKLTLAEYLELEEKSQDRHEYLAGDVRAMSGVSKRHNYITGRLYNAFSSHLGEGPCRVFIEGVKLWMKVVTDEYVYYPDVFVACGLKLHDKDHEDYLVRDAAVIVEVLSPSTESVDRGRKLMHYGFVPALQEYVLVEQNRWQVTLHRRSNDWHPIVLDAFDSVAEFRSINLSLPLSQIYRGVLAHSPHEESPILEEIGGRQQESNLPGSV